MLEPVRSSSYYGFTEFRIEPKDLPRLDIDRVFLEIIEGVVSDSGRLSASSLKDLTYQTPPMEDAVEHGANEELLDFSDVRPAPEIGPALRRLRKVVREAGTQVDDAGAMDDLISEIESLAPARAAANRGLLG